METVLANLLLAHAPLAALVEQNIDWDEAPQGIEAPLIVMFLISTEPTYTYSGPVKLVGRRVQFDCRGRTREVARQIAEALDAKLSGYRGEFEGVRFGGAFKQGHRTRARTEASSWFTASVDYLIWSATA
ncbi:hypothetical protein [Devosia sp. 2618]|uniref:tail completion protein gp17 n=1 Tax=Devosia sp. 2618 TaxID=3156454 RepID=UPI0033919AD3